MEVGRKAEVIRALKFGNQIAEEEREALKEYFVKTQAWDRILNGEVDIIYGPKGAGKSALYVLTQDHIDELFDRSAILLSAENPRGTPVFRDLDVNPPTNEREFVAIWKLYFLTLIARAFDDFGINNSASKEVLDRLAEHGLMPAKKTTLGAILQTVRAYASKIMRGPSAVEGGIVFQPETGLPVGITGKILFEDPQIEQQKVGYVSIDELLAKANEALEGAGFYIWLMLDRLDVAFDESSDLERNALRALFRVYRDNRNQDQIKIKIFLRTDIWKRITEDGFREATHMSRDISLTWDKASLKNLIIRRLLSNPGVVDIYSVNQDLILQSTRRQDEFFNRVFPDQVEIGEKQSNTLDWMIRRTADGSKLTQPRDIILFLNNLAQIQNRRLERGEPEPQGEWLFDRVSFKEALPHLSEYKVNRQLFAEYPVLRPYIEALREQKTELNVESLSRVWGIDQEKTIQVAKALRDAGFFEERTSKGETTFWIPFVYRSYLSLSQGKMQELQSSGTISDLSWLDSLLAEEQADEQGRK